MWFFCFILSLALAPMQIGVINKVKAFFAGRRGPGVVQPYFDIAKLLKKGGAHSASGSVVLMAAPAAAFAAFVAAALFFPFGMAAAPFGFPGDVVLFFCLIGAGRLFMALGAFDTASAFEGMGATRELQFAAFAEAIVFVVAAFLALATKRLDLTGLLNGYDSKAWAGAGTSILLCAMAFYAALLAENCRAPFDDPDTHLELTMIHEAMVLDYAGPDLALIQLGAAVKLWLFASFLTLMLAPFEAAAHPAARAALYFGGVGAVSVAVGATESAAARFRFLKLPQVFAGALAAALVAILLFAFKK
jgi:Formate hydrogenlyase subunit 4